MAGKVYGNSHTPKPATKLGADAPTSAIHSAGRPEPRKSANLRVEVYADIWEMLSRSYARNNLRAIAAATGTAKTAKPVECEASQSGGTAASPDRHGGIA